MSPLEALPFPILHHTSIKYNPPSLYLFINTKLVPKHRILGWKLWLESGQTTPGQHALMWRSFSLLGCGEKAGRRNKRGTRERKKRREKEKRERQENSAFTLNSSQVKVRAEPKPYIGMALAMATNAQVTR